MYSTFLTSHSCSHCECYFNELWRKKMYNLSIQATRQQEMWVVDEWEIWDSLARMASELKASLVQTKELLILGKVSSSLFFSSLLRLFSGIYLTPSPSLHIQTRLETWFLLFLLVPPSNRPFPNLFIFLVHVFDLVIFPSLVEKKYPTFLFLRPLLWQDVRDGFFLYIFFIIYSYSVWSKRERGSKF